MQTNLTCLFGNTRDDTRESLGRASHAFMQTLGVNPSYKLVKFKTSTCTDTLHFATDIGSVCSSSFDELMLNVLRCHETY